MFFKMSQMEILELKTGYFKDQAIETIWSEEKGRNGGKNMIGAVGTSEQPDASRTWALLLESRGEGHSGAEETVGGIMIKAFPNLVKDIYLQI